MKTTTRLRQMLAEPGMIVAPGSYDCISARTIEQAGYSCAYMTGAGTSMSRGFPDYGLLTMSEMVENAAAIARSIDIPLISDADTGYGNELNVTRTVREFEGRGVAGIHIEDQVSPTRGGHLHGKEVISRAEYGATIRAAVAARRDPDFVIIARTDARAVMGLDEAIARARLACEAGADVGFVEAVQSAEEMAAVPKQIGKPCLLNVVQGGKTPLVELEEAKRMGYRLAILPGLLFTVAIDAMDTILADLKKTGKAPPRPKGATVADTFRRFGTEDWDRIRRGEQASSPLRMTAAE
jgi:2-methylisocitrate lyase-like PEP mutase family enzyme